eukprot:5502502-Pyramimonas_sp.AAC.1
MALREERITTRIRWTIHVPTEIMIADAMTKPGTFKQMMKLLTTGFLDMEMISKLATVRRIQHPPADYTESDLETIQRFNGQVNFEIHQMNDSLMTEARIRCRPEPPLS